MLDQFLKGIVQPHIVLLCCSSLEFDSVDLLLTADVDEEANDTHKDSRNRLLPTYPRYQLELLEPHVPHYHQSVLLQLISLIDDQLFRTSHERRTFDIGVHLY